LTNGKVAYASLLNLCFSLGLKARARSSIVWCGSGRAIVQIRYHFSK